MCMAGGVSCIFSIKIHSSPKWTISSHRQTPTCITGPSSSSTWCLRFSRRSFCCTLSTTGPSLPVGLRSARSAILTAMPASTSTTTALGIRTMGSHNPYWDKNQYLYPTGETANQADKAPILSKCTCVTYNISYALHWFYPTLQWISVWRIRWSTCCRVLCNTK